MNQWKNVAAMLALSTSAALVGTGCMAQTGDEEEDQAGDPSATMVGETPELKTAVQADEKTGEANQKCFGGFGGFGGCGLGGFGLGWGGFGGCGLGGFGGWGGFGGCGCGLGGFGLGWGGFGGCGLGGFGGCW